MLGSAGHFAFVSWLLAVGMLAFALTLTIAVIVSWRSTRRRPVGVTEATRVLVSEGLITREHRRELLIRYARGES